MIIIVSLCPVPIRKCASVNLQTFRLSLLAGDQALLLLLPTQENTIQRKLGTQHCLTHYCTRQICCGGFESTDAVFVYFYCCYYYYFIFIFIISAIAM